MGASSRITTPPVAADSGVGTMDGMATGALGRHGSKYDEPNRLVDDGDVAFFPDRGGFFLEQGSTSAVGRPSVHDNLPVDGSLRMGCEAAASLTEVAPPDGESANLVGEGSGLRGIASSVDAKSLDTHCDGREDGDCFGGPGWGSP